MNKTQKTLKTLLTLLLVGMIFFSTFTPSLEVKAAPTEVPTAALGIDVSRYQGQIDWSQVAAAGVQFAIVRVGYRTQATGLINEDPYARYNLQEAQKYGIKLGAYFFSTAITTEEAVEEAMFTANIIDNYQITYPVVYNCEGYSSASSRQHDLGKTSRSNIATAFLNTIANRGYTPMFYASKNEMQNSQEWDMEMLASRYKVWVSWYPQLPFPETPACTYTGVHHMWQYTQKGSIPGIAGTVDMNVAYFSYADTGVAKNTNGVAQIDATNASNVQYTPVYEVVTAKNQTNLRTVPSTNDATTVIATIKNGDMIYRIGVGNNGWSKVLINGQECYAYSSYLVKVA